MTFSLYVRVPLNKTSKSLLVFLSDMIKKKREKHLNNMLHNTKQYIRK